MMMLIRVGVATAYRYSSAVVFGLRAYCAQKGDAQCGS